MIDFKKYGFNVTSRGTTKRIHELLYLEIDEHGFALLSRKNEFAVKRHQFDRITLPKPVRTEEELERLLSVLGVTYGTTN